MNEEIILKSKKKNLKVAVALGWVSVVIIACLSALLVYSSWNSYFNRQKAVVDYLNSLDINFADAIKNTSVLDNSYEEQVAFYMSILVPDYTYETLYSAFVEVYYDDNPDFSEIKGEKLRDASLKLYERLLKQQLKEQAEECAIEIPKFKVQVKNYLTTEMKIPEDVTFSNLFQYTDFGTWAKDSKEIRISVAVCAASIVIILILQVVCLVERKKFLELSEEKVLCTKSNGKIISMPINQNMIAKAGVFNSVVITTRRYKYRILAVKNRNEIVSAIKAAKDSLNKRKTVTEEV